VAVDNTISVTTTALAGMTMPLAGIVEPLNATNRSISWSVKDAGSTRAEVNGNTFIATAAGTATVTATIEKGRSADEGYTQDFNIAVMSFFVWKGELASAPEEPELNWAYYNSSDKTAYIWNGSEWEKMSVVSGLGEGIIDSDGIAVEVSEDGYLVINGEKTDVKVQGESGDSGIILQYYTVKYNANGGSGTMADSSLAIGFWEKLEKNTFTKTGFVFNGWSKTPNGQPEYADEGFVKNLSTIHNESVTLYAVWGAPNTYTVSYNANGGNGTMPPSVFTLGLIYTLSLNTFTRTGYTFEGWATEPDGTVVFTDGQIASYLTTTAGETVYLYAVWKAITYTVIYDANGGNGTMVDSVFTYDDAQALRTNSFTQIGHVVIGWSTSTEGSVEFANEETVINLCLNNGDILTLYAIWEDRSLTITFDPDNGSPATNEIVIDGISFVKPADPVKTLSILTVLGLYFGTAPDYYYYFKGWYKGDELWDFDDPATGNTIVDKVFAYVNANPGEYTLLIGEDIDITGTNDRALNHSNIQLTLLGLNIERKINLTLLSQGRIFTVGASGQIGICLTLGDNITLVGHSSNNASLVYVQENASLIMRDNSTVSDNTAGIYGGGVYVTGGNFTMTDNASVSGNTAVGVYWYADDINAGRVGGGGVCVRGSAFTMTDNASVSGNYAVGYGGGVVVYGIYGSLTMSDNALVSGNTVVPVINSSSCGGGVHVSGASSLIMQDNASFSGNTSDYGGGVYLYNLLSIFRISGGTVFGNDSGITDNMATIGAALYWFVDGTAQYGTFDGTNWGPLTDIPVSPVPSMSNNFYRNETIKVVNGVLQ